MIARYEIFEDPDHDDYIGDYGVIFLDEHDEEVYVSFGWHYRKAAEYYAEDYMRQYNMGTWRIETDLGYAELDSQSVTVYKYNHVLSEYDKEFYPAASNLMAFGMARQLI